MNVGIYVGSGGPESGGAYGFVRAVVNGLNAVPSAHKLHVLHDGFEGLTGGPTIQVTRIGQRAKASIGRRVLDRLSPARRSARNDRQFNAEIDALRLHLLWFLTPLTIPTRVPYAITVWDLAHRLEPEFPEVSTTGWTWSQRETHYRAWLPPAAYVITGAAACRDTIVRCYGVDADRIRILPLVAPRLEVKPAGDATSPAPYLFYPAQFWPHKNHVGLLLALKALHDRHDLPLRLVLTGADKGNLAHVTSTAKELGLEAYVEMLGFVSNERLATLYRDATALVFPSFFGPDNLPPLEALQLGCPVIAANVPGAAEQLGDAALLIDPRDPESIANSVARLVKEPGLRQTLVDRGHARAARWTAADYATAMLRIVDEFATERRCWSDSSEYVHL